MRKNILIDFKSFKNYKWPDIQGLEGEALSQDQDQKLTRIQTKEAQSQDLEYDHVVDHRLVMLGHHEEEKVSQRIRQKMTEILGKKVAEILGIEAPTGIIGREVPTEITEQHGKADREATRMIGHQDIIKSRTDTICAPGSMQMYLATNLRKTGEENQPMSQ